VYYIETEGRLLFTSIGRRIDVRNVVIMQGLRSTDRCPVMLVTELLR